MRILRRTFAAAAACLALVGTAACGGEKSGTETAAAPGATASNTLQVGEIQLGNAVGADKRIMRPMDEFRPTETVYLTVPTTGTAQNATLRVRWTFEDGQLVDESTRTISPSGAETTEFHVSKPSGWPAGEYKAEVFLDDRPVGSKEFEVKQ
jgi:hypothetical protein